MSNVIEILVSGRNTSGTSIAAAEAQLRGLQATSGRVGGALAQAAGNMVPMSSGLGNVASAAGPAGLALAAVASAAIGMGTAIYKSAVALTDQVEQLERLSRQTGVNTQNLQVLQRIARESGADVGSLTQGFSFLNRAIAENNPMLAALGITTRDTFTAFMQLANILSQSKDTANATKIAIELLGRGGKDLLGTVSELVRQFPEMRSEMEALGLTMSDETIAALNKVDARLDAAQRRWDAFFQQLKIMSSPVAGFLAEALSPPVSTQSSPLSGLDAAQQSRLQRSFKASMPEMPKDFILAAPTFEKMSAAFSDAAGAAKQTADEQLKSALRAKDMADAQAKAAEAAKKHAEVLRAVQEAFGVSADEAGRMVGVVEQLEKNRAMDKLRAKVVEAQQAFRSLNDLIADALRKTDMLATGPRATGARGQLKPTEKVEGVTAADVEKLRVKTGPEQMSAMLDQWQTFTDQVFSGAELLNAGLSAVQQGLTTGFQTAFSSMLSGAMSFAQAMRAIFQSLVSAIIAELARLAAYAVVKGLLNLATGGASGAATSVAGDLVNRAKAVTAPNSVVNSTTVNISALDARSVLQQTLSPSGALRLTNLRTAELAAVS